MDDTGTKTILSPSSDPRTIVTGGHGHGAGGYGGYDWPERTAERIRGQAHADTQWANEAARDITTRVGDVITALEQPSADRALRARETAPGLDFSRAHELSRRLMR